MHTYISTQILCPGCGGNVEVDQFEKKVCCIKAGCPLSKTTFPIDFFKCLRVAPNPEPLHRKSFQTYPEYDGALVDDEEGPLTYYQNWMERKTP